MTRWDDELVQHGFFNRVAQLAPGLVFYFGSSAVPAITGAVEKIIHNVSLAYLALMAMLAVGALLSAANSIYEQRPGARNRPIKGYLQVARIVIYIIGAIIIVATLMERSPLLLLSGFGAMTAVLILVFQDTLLSLVASIQISGNNMVRVGDWIEMPGYDADGDVVDIALHTVKVQNWDKTITTIPTHKLITESFRNWRGMQQSGGRRIKRSICLDIGTVRFLTPTETSNFQRFGLLRDYVDRKEQQLDRHNQSLEAIDSDVVNARRLTNLGTFRAYVYAYLRNHAEIHQGMTILVRQLAPGPDGLPLEVYAFTATTDWNEYERIQADIFDHILAIAPQFGLKIFQRPSGDDLRSLAGTADL